MTTILPRSADETQPDTTAMPTPPLPTTTTAAQPATAADAQRMGATGDGAGGGTGARGTMAIWLMVFVAISCYSVWSSLNQFGRWFSKPNIRELSASFRSTDIDHTAILASVDRCPSFVSSFQWWTHPWVGLCYYWRPVTSQFFWLEHSFFGDARYDMWSAVSVFLHVIAVVLVGVLAWQLSKRLIAVAVAAAFFSSPSMMGVAMSNWKDQPDLLMTAFVLCALIAATYKNWMATVIFASLAMCTKEFGWVALPLLLGLVLANRTLRNVPYPAIAAQSFVCLAVVFLMRDSGFFSSAHNVVGSNSHALPIYLNTLYLPIAKSAILGQWDTAVLSLVLVPLFIPIPRWARIASILAVIAATITVGSLCRGIDPSVEFALLIENAGQPDFILTFASTTAVAAYFAFAQKNLMALFLMMAYALCVVNISLVLSCQSHVLYLSNAIFSIFIGYCAASFGWSRFMTKLGDLFTRQKPTNA